MLGEKSRDRYYGTSHLWIRHFAPLDTPLRTFGYATPRKALWGNSFRRPYNTTLTYVYNNTRTRCVVACGKRKGVRYAHKSFLFFYFPFPWQSLTKLFKGSRGNAGDNSLTLSAKQTDRDICLQGAQGAEGRALKGRISRPWLRQVAITGPFDCSHTSCICRSKP